MKLEEMMKRTKRLDNAMSNVEFNEKTIRQLEKLLAYYSSKKEKAHNLMYEVNTSDKWKENPEGKKITQIAVNAELRVYECIIEDLEDLLNKTKKTYDECFKRFEVELEKSNETYN